MPPRSGRGGTKFVFPTDISSEMRLRSANKRVLMGMLSRDELDVLLSHCSEDSLRTFSTVSKSVFSAAKGHLYRKLCIALQGPTPENTHADKLGVFIKRKELVNGYASYAKAGEAKVMLWRAGPCWIIGPTSEVGNRTAFVQLEKDSLCPEAARGTWQVAMTSKKWVAAPELQCLAGDALVAELAKAPPQLALDGPMLQHLNNKVKGLFVKRKYLVNGYPSYAKATESRQMLWHAGNYWTLGYVEDLGTTCGIAKLSEGCLSPGAARVAWEVYESSEKKWVEVPELRCLAGEALAAAQREAAPRIALQGEVPQNFHNFKLGVFIKREDLVNGYPCYVQLGDATKMMWHAGLWWMVGVADELGQARGYMKLDEGCLRPEHSRGMWRVNKRDAWIEAPEVRCFAGCSDTPRRRVWDSNSGKWVGKDFWVFEDVGGSI